MTHLPKISVVIPIRNEEKFIAQTIEYLMKQDYPEELLELLVIDGQSDDNTVDIVKEISDRDSRVKLLTNPKRLSSAARNIGAKNASGDIITYVDGHTYIDNDQLLKSIAQLMVQKEVSVLSRPQFLDTPDNDFFQKAVSLARKSTFGHGLDSTIYTDEDKYVVPTSSGASYKREVFEKAGYFDERFDACEDVEFNYRVHKSGFRSFTSLKLAVYYYPRDSFKKLYYQMKRYGTGRFRLACKHPETLSLGTLVPFLFLTGMPLLAIGSFFFEWSCWLFGSLTGLYILISIVSSLMVAFKHGFQYLFHLPFIYITIHSGLGWGFLCEMLKKLTGRGIDFSAKILESSPSNS